MSRLAAEFDDEMLSLYRQWKSDFGYNATYFKRMLENQGGVSTAKRLLAKQGTSKGFLTLLTYGRLDLSVEALVLRLGFRPLFSAEELATSTKRLSDHGYPQKHCG